MVISSDYTRPPNIHLSADSKAEGSYLPVLPALHVLPVLPVLPVLSVLLYFFFSGTFVTFSDRVYCNVTHSTTYVEMFKRVQYLPSIAFTILEIQKSCLDFSTLTQSQRRIICSLFILITPHIIVVK